MARAADGAALALSPIEMWAALVNVTGYVPLPLTGEDHIELLPVRWQPINDYGIRFDYRTYDDPVLNGFRRRRSVSGVRERFEVHHNPYDPTLIWVRLDNGFEPVPWIHATQVEAPFTDSLWRHVRSTVARTADRDAHELALARALDALLKRVAAGAGTHRQRRIAARAATAAATGLAPDRPGPAGRDGGMGQEFFPGPVQAAFDDGYDEDEGDVEAEDYAEAEKDEVQQGAPHLPGPRASGGALNPRQEADLWL